MTPEPEKVPTTSPARSEITVTKADPRALLWWQLPYLAVAIIWLSAVYVVSHSLDMGVFVFGLGILLLGVPMCLAGICTGTLRRQRRLSAMFRRQGWLYTLLSGRWLSIILWTVWGLGMSSLLLVQFHIYAPAEWAVLASTIPVFAVLFTIIRRRLVAEGLHEDVAITAALGWSRWFSTAIVLVFYVVTMMWWGDLPQFESFEAAIDKHRPAAAGRSESALVREGLHWIGYFDGVKVYALGRFGATDAIVAFLLMGLGTAAFLYHTCLALSCFRIPRFGFLQARLVPLSSIDAFRVAAVTTILVVFIYLPLLFYLDLSVSKSPAFADFREKVETAIKGTVVLVEEIDGDLFTTGTIDEINDARKEAMIQFGKEVERFQSEMDATFQRLENDAVDEYLDWYYSLAGEWVRLFMLAGGTGRLEVHLAQKVRETFEDERWYAGINAAFENLLSTNEEVQKAHEQRVRTILDRNRLDSPRSEHAKVQVALTASLNEVLQLSLQQELIDSARRLLGAGVGSAAVGKGVATIVAQKVAAKLSAKTALKVAAKAPVKALLSKVAASAAGGAAGGSALGSILPGPGTAAGALVGILAGLAFGAAIDLTLLELEEQLSRDDFRREIVAAIREARREFEEEYFGSQYSEKASSPWESLDGD